MMATGTLVSMEEYLSTSYRPDREYVDALILERNLGEEEIAGLCRLAGPISAVAEALAQ